MCEMMARGDKDYVKEYPLDSMKVSGTINKKKSVRICFTCEDETSIHIWLKRLVLEDVILD
jgi:Tfp pilus assembly protein PilP